MSIDESNDVIVLHRFPVSFLFSHFPNQTRLKYKKYIVGVLFALFSTHVVIHKKQILHKIDKFLCSL